VHNAHVPTLVSISIKPQDSPVATMCSREDREAALLFKVLGDPIRLAILRILAEEGESFVGQFNDRLGITGPAISHHLRLLRACGLVEFRRKGPRSIYTLVDGLDGVIGRTDHALNVLRKPSPKAGKAKRPTA
jgi:ArsR family transcriptional regulator, arsenate/arsenite/antimonite-responsive transcriptional repressor